MFIALMVYFFNSLLQKYAPENEERIKYLNIELGFPFSHPNFFPMGMGKIGNWEIFPWEFLGIFQNRKNAKKRTFLIALLFLLFFFQSLFPFKVTS